MKNKLKKYSKKEHKLSKKQLPSYLIKVLTGLDKAGYDAYIVGGCIRDLLLDKVPKDFDVVTNATPEQIRAVFKNCRLIGKRFRLAHIYFGRNIVEVATFRSLDKGETDNKGRVLNQNIFGNMETDVFRRDFTINALYYNIFNNTIYDFVGGMEDLQNSILRIIGNAKDRYKEDPVRMLRAVRFVSKLDMSVEEETKKQIKKQKYLLANVPKARISDEIEKFFMSGHAFASFKNLKKYGLFETMFLPTKNAIKEANPKQQKRFKKLIKIALKNTDNRLQQGKPATIGFIYAVFLWAVYLEIYKKSLIEKDWYVSMHDSISETFSLSNELIVIPNRHKTFIRNIWTMQVRLTGDINKKRIQSILFNKRFRASFDFLEIRLQAGEKKLTNYYKVWVEAQNNPQKALKLYKTYSKTNK